MIRKVGWSAVGITAATFGFIAVARPEWIIIPPSPKDMALASLKCSHACNRYDTDLNNVLAYYGTNSHKGDLNHDGTVNVLDLSIALTRLETHGR